MYCWKRAKYLSSIWETPHPKKKSPCKQKHTPHPHPPFPVSCDPRLFQGTMLCVIQIDLESFQTDKSALKIWTLGVFRWSFGCYWSIDIAQVLHGVSGGLLSRYILLCNAAYIHCLHAYILESNNSYIQKKLRRLRWIFNQFKRDQYLQWIKKNHRRVFKFCVLFSFE